jgi:hypothetical protein
LAWKHGLKIYAGRRRVVPALPGKTPLARLLLHFTDRTQWIVSGVVVLGDGWTRFRQSGQRLKLAAHSKTQLLFPKHFFRT